MKQDIESRVFDKLGNPLFAASLQIELYNLNGGQSVLSKIKEMQQEFFSNLDEIIASDYQPKDKVNNGSLIKFYEFRDLDWTSKDNLRKLELYLASLKSSY